MQEEYDIDRHAQVLALKAMVVEGSGTLAADIRLVYRGHPLVDAHTLHQHEIADGARIKFVPTLHGGGSVEQGRNPVCCLCGSHCDDPFSHDPTRIGFDFDPAPIADSGRCCFHCHQNRVLPAAVMLEVVLAYFEERDLAARPDPPRDLTQQGIEPNPGWPVDNPVPLPVPRRMSERESEDLAIEVREGAASRAVRVMRIMVAELERKLAGDDEVEEEYDEELETLHIAIGAEHILARQNPQPTAGLTHYKFRSECQVDVARWFWLMPDGSVVNIDVTEPDISFGDRDVEFFSSESLEVIRAAMRRVIDGHVMLQTVARFEDYTPERDYDLE